MLPWTSTPQLHQFECSLSTFWMNLPWTSHSAWPPVTNITWIQYVPTQLSNVASTVGFNTVVSNTTTNHTSTTTYMPRNHQLPPVLKITQSTLSNTHTNILRNASLVPAITSPFSHRSRLTCPGPLMLCRWCQSVVFTQALLFCSATAAQLYISITTRQYPNSHHN